MTEQKKRRALILYASITGNTEKVAMRFKQTIEKKGQPWGDWECDVLKANKNTYREKHPYNIKDYDLLLVGGPIWAGIPPLYLFDDHKGALPTIMTPEILAQIKKVPGESGGPAEPGGPGEPMPAFDMGPGDKKGVVFVTYGGQGQGPVEAMASLAVLEGCLQRVRCVGKFACCGKQWREPTVDPIAAQFDLMVGDATVEIDKFRENPNHPDFAKLTPQERQMFEKAVGMTSEYSGSGAERPGFRAWHWDFSNRPNERDLLKAEIFLSEILEDCYGGGIEKTPATVSQYICIA